MSFEDSQPLVRKAIKKNMICINTDQITTPEYQFEALHLDKSSLLIKGGRLFKLHFMAMFENSTTHRTRVLSSIWIYITATTLLSQGGYTIVGQR